MKKSNKARNKTITKVVAIAKEYVKAGYKYGQAIDMAQQDVEKAERERYEGNGC